MAASCSSHTASGATQQALVCVLVALLTAAVVPVSGQCPWPKNLTDLNAACSCSFVLSRLAVRCSSVNVTRLLGALRETDGGTGAPPPPIDSLHVTNSSVAILADDAFYNLRVTTVQFAGCGLRNISANALRDLEHSLFTLNLPDNELTEGALAPLRKLASLTSLDLSQNRIRSLPNDAFKGLALDTLNLMENNITNVGQWAFLGLEATLKNLNLKGIGLMTLPGALRNLTALAFLDLAQNSIKDLGTGFFGQMDSLTALSLERNQLSHLEPSAFLGLEDSMSSLSLLNNHFQELPTGAVSILKELRVLDLGFNQILQIAKDAFKNTTSLTLLALDGNPLSTLPFDAFKHLQATLRGLSIGGRSLVCDCNIRWIAEWVREYDLQVTSRERNPQFCGHPAAQRNKNLYLLRPAQLVCPEETTTTTPVTTVTSTTTATSSISNANSTASQAGDAEASTAEAPGTRDQHSTTTPQNLTNETTTTTTTTTTTSVVVGSSTSAPSVGRNTSAATTTTDASRQNNPPFLVQSPHNNQRSARKETGQDIRIVKAIREDSTIIIMWDVIVPNVPGFRVIYRTFGDIGFKEGAVLPLRVHKFRMTNVPLSECIVVCVVSLAEKGNLTVDNVPSANCREMKSDHSQVAGHSDIDKIIIIAASAAICAAVIIAVIIFVCCHRRHHRHEKQPPPLPPPIVGLPPMEPSKPEWDNASAYSSRSIPRARMYHLGRAGGTVNSAFLPDDARSHLSHMSSKHNGDDRAQSLIDGQYGGYVGVVHTNTLPNPYPLGRPDTNRSTKSLAQAPYHGTSRKKRPLQRNGKWGSVSHNGSMHLSGSGYNAENGYFHPNPWSGTEIEHYPSGNHIREPFNKRDYT